MSEDLTLVIGNRIISGWQSVRLTRGIERCPNDFDIAFTELFPGEAADLIIQPGDACTVFIGGDLVVTGYVDKFHPAITPTSHMIRVTGRGKCQDLVDCAAEWPGGQISGSSALQIAQKLAMPYGISVSATEADVGPVIPQKNLILTETAYEIIERICRFRGLLCYELPDGSLFLTDVGTTSAASGFTQGQNVQEASIEYSMDQRYSEYHCFLQSVDTFNDVGGSGNLLGIGRDPGVPRNRKMSLISEGGGLGNDVCIRRAVWESVRRLGRANRLVLKTDSWRDSAGALWTPNTLVPLSLPVLKIEQVNWLIGEVTYKRDEYGTTANLVIMPPAAFIPQPIVYQQFMPDVPIGTQQ